MIASLATGGRAAVRQAELRDAFSRGWIVESIDPVHFHINLEPPTAEAWLARITSYRLTRTDAARHAGGVVTLRQGPGTRRVIASRTTRKETRRPRPFWSQARPAF